MFKIGDFSKLSMLSIRMLRHYDGLGLLTPEKTNAFTGYRYYAACPAGDGKPHQGAFGHGLWLKRNKGNFAGA